MTPHLIVFVRSGARPGASAPVPGRVLRGDPRRPARNHGTGVTGRFSAGIRESHARTRKRHAITALQKNEA